MAKKGYFAAKDKLDRIAARTAGGGKRIGLKPPTARQIEADERARAALGRIFGGTDSGQG